VTRNRSSHVDIGRQVGRPPSPRERNEARVPLLDHPQAHSSQFPTYRVPPDQSAHDQTTHDRDSQFRRTAIETLLTHYRDVLEGIPDREHRRSDDLLALMCPAWNHRSYRQLERLLEQLKAERPKLHAKLVTRFLRFSERRVAYCRRCGEHPSSDVGKVHAHPPGRSITLRSKMLRVLPRNDDPAGVSLAIAWLEQRWSGRADLPKAVFEIEAEQRLRAA